METLEDILTTRLTAALLPIIDERIALARQHPAAESLRELRERLGKLNTPAVAAEAKLTINYLNRLECGAHAPTKPTIAAIARALGCSTAEVAAAAAESVYRRKQKQAKKAQ